MDPDACLKRLLELAHGVMDCIDNETPLDESDVDALAQHVHDLDNWIVKGGFLPARWRQT